MKKMIRDRSIFVVAASVIMAAVMLFCSAQPARIHLPKEAREILGQEADASFSQFFVELQDWYDSYTVGEEGITLTYENDFAGLEKVVMSTADFLEAYNVVATEDLATVENACVDMMAFLVNYLVVVFTVNDYGSYPFDAAQWAALGETIDALVAFYQA